MTNTSQPRTEKAAAISSVTEGSSSQALRDLLRLLGARSLHSGAAAEANHDRDMPEQPAELLDTATLDVSGQQPVKVDAFIDGIQTSLRIGYRDHRPIYLNYVAAGALRDNTDVIVTREQLDVVCSEPDADWLHEQGCTLNIVSTAEQLPYKLVKESAEKLAGVRVKLEREVTREALKMTTGYIVIDGHLFGLEPNDRLIGIVKSTNTRYLADESILWDLPLGWRSPRFLLEGIRGGRAESGALSRISAYLRLMDASDYGWDFGLIRVESWNRDMIDSACAMALSHKMAPGEYNRWDRHLRGVANVEKLLKARRPTVFDLF